MKLRRELYLPRENWQARLEGVGMTWHAETQGHPVPYWEEGAAYHFTHAQIERLAAASQRLTTRVLEATGHAIDSERLSELGIPEYLHEHVANSWHRDDPTAYMRLDLAWDGVGEPKLLEVNGQTPTSLLEASVCAWHWLEDNQESGQLPEESTAWNNIHEALLTQWGYIKRQGWRKAVFSAARNDEDRATAVYMQELAAQMGVQTEFLFTEDIGTDPARSHLLDLRGNGIRQMFWLWPYEFAWDSEDAFYLVTTDTRLMEPLWKAVTSSKGLLAMLHELYPDDPGILPASLRPGTLSGPAVTKPLFSREGQNVTLPGKAPTPGEYGGLPLMEQAYVELPELQTPGGKRYPVMGVWVAGDEVCGLGIREGRGRVTDNRASFVPHVVEGG